jgi:uroporphyrinogen decarboxylase
MFSAQASTRQSGCLKPVRAIVAKLRLRHKDARVIGFPKGPGGRFVDYAERTNIDALGLDTSTDLG